MYSGGRSWPSELSLTKRNEAAEAGSLPVAYNATARRDSMLVKKNGIILHKNKISCDTCLRYVDASSKPRTAAGRLPQADMYRYTCVVSSAKRVRIFLKERRSRMDVIEDKCGTKFSRIRNDFVVLRRNNGVVGRALR
ncbi:hypothetical protein EVAR_62641_1 [Eumeta japonica]|uniref:Uncharacterized protein n=1 Tax=Eumeta variegata TaxID=151549 RepID=A0A4C2AE41_EUMVA|nr:hypothetical protein EVAR_62641_1 [Eumeta japonica]